MQSGSAELEIEADGCWGGGERSHVHVFVLEGTQCGWEEQSTFYHRMGKSVI